MPIVVKGESHRWQPRPVDRPRPAKTVVAVDPCPAPRQTGRGRARRRAGVGHRRRRTTRADSSVKHGADGADPARRRHSQRAKGRTQPRSLQDHSHNRPGRRDKDQAGGGAARVGRAVTSWFGRDGGTGSGEDVRFKCSVRTLGPDSQLPIIQGALVEWTVIPSGGCLLSEERRRVRLDP